VGTAALRGILVALAVVLGLIVLAKAFPDSAPATDTAPAASTPTVSPAAQQPTTGQTTQPTTPASPTRVEGVVVQVLNGTDVSGLAAKTGDTLTSFGYNVVEVGDYSSRDYKKTYLYHRPDSLAVAQRLKAEFFPKARLEEATNNLKKNVQVTVVVGLDAAT
jgi:hypothetical protein